MAVIEVVAAVCISEKTVFAAQRGPKGKQAFLWEFPGGKIEPGETSEEALVREIKEELAADIVVDFPVATVEHSYGDDITIRLHAYCCSLVPGSSFSCCEHVDSAWLGIDDLSSVSWAGADIALLPYVVALLR